ncbi:MAG: signal peptidase I [Clostridiales bacterium]|jgi:signal peptidase I|nr:signal peptidase I [Clostridiales bacterium]
MKDVKNDIKEWIQAILIAIVVSVVIRLFLFETTLVYGNSMESTLRDRDRVIINKLVYHLYTPSRGDIVVFKNPDNSNENYVKRVIGIAGDTVEVLDQKVYINDQLLDEPYLDVETENDFPKFEVPEDTIFVMGDNRNRSQDSRYIGPIPVENIIGKAQLRIWPISDFTFFR